MMRIYYTPTDKSISTEQLVIGLYKLYCEEKGLPYNSDGKVLRTEKGKPYFDGCDVFFSVSHTNLLTAVCYAPYNIGIDCENINRKLKHAELIKEKIYSQKEREYSADNERFLEIWVKKEAYIKYTGKGLSDIFKFDTFSLKGNFNLTRYNSHIICTYYE